MRTLETVPPVLDGVLPPPLGVVVPGGLQPGPSGSTPPAGRRGRVGVVVAELVRRGRSAKRTATPRSSAQRSATHSGEKTANG